MVHKYNLDKISDVRILVIGDLMLDHYMWGKCDRISPEAPVPIVDIEREETLLGGAGNVLKNLISFGAKADVISVIGDDLEGKELCRLLDELGINIEGVFIDSSRKTSKKTRIVASGHQLLRVDNETTDFISNVAEDLILSIVNRKIATYSLVLISDYFKGTLTDRVLKEVIESSNANKVKVVIDPKGNDYARYKGAYIIKPNRKEASIATGIQIKDELSLREAAKALKNKVECHALIITLSEDGMAIYDNDFEIIATKANEIFDVTGAGDTVLASLGVCLSTGLSLKDSCIFANHAAAIVVSKVGSAVTTIDEVFQHILSDPS